MEVHSRVPVQPVLHYLKLGATEYPRAQLWSIQDYFDNRMPMLPALADPYTGKPVQGSLQMSL